MPTEPRINLIEAWYMDSVRCKIIGLIILAGFTCSCFSSPEELGGSAQLRPPELLSDSASLKVYFRPRKSLNASDSRIQYEVTNLTGLAFLINMEKSPSNWYVSVNDDYWSYVNSRLKHALDYCDNKSKRSEKELYRPHLYDCGIREPVRITSDVTLYGRPPGSNLADLCYIVQVYLYNNMLSCSYPDNVVVSEVPAETLDSNSLLLDDYLSVGYTLYDMHEVYFAFSSDPEERPSAFSIYMDIPIECHYWYGLPETRSFMSAIDHTEKLPPAQRVLHAETHIQLPFTSNH